MFRRAVATIEGVKADPLFSYLPPVNLVALVVMLPASYILSPRWFHKVCIFASLNVLSSAFLFCAVVECLHDSVSYVCNMSNTAALSAATGSPTFRFCCVLLGMNDRRRPLAPRDSMKL